MTNNELVMTTFDQVGDPVQHNVALIHAIRGSMAQTAGNSGGPG